MSTISAPQIAPAISCPRTTSTSMSSVAGDPLHRIQRSAGNIAVSGLILRKLRIGAPDSPEEREADRVAAEVMRMPDGAGPVAIGSYSPVLHRKCAACSEEEEQIHRSATGEGPGTAPPIVNEVLSQPGKPLLKSPLSRRGEEPIPESLPERARYVNVHADKQFSKQSIRERNCVEQREVTSYQDVGEISPIVYSVLRSPGHEIGKDIRAFLEPRFGHDFGRVRVHSDVKAAESAKKVNATAYTVGQHVVFAAGKYQPNTAVGIHLLAHELAHVIQHERGLGSTGSIAASVPYDGQVASLPSNRQSIPEISHRNQSLSRFADQQHHIIEQAALMDTDFTEPEKRQINEANKKRDFSQLPAGLNLFLICEANDFGTYVPAEHFDDFAWSEDLFKWQPKNAVPSSGTVSLTPLDYIRSQLMRFAENPQDVASLGNAFHTIEDFFSHSNFIELIQTPPDYRHGKKLMTGSFGAADKAASLSHKLGSVAVDSITPYYEEQESRYRKRTGFDSHSRIAKDEPGSDYFSEARLLAALVIQSLSRRLTSLRGIKNTEERRTALNLVITSIESYLRPPDHSERWWDQLAADDAKWASEQAGRRTMREKIDVATRTMTVTANHCAISPLKNLELSRDMPVIMPIGVVRLRNVGGNQFFIQAGYGLIRPNDTPNPMQIPEVPKPEFGIAIQGSMTHPLGNDGKKVDLHGSVIVSDFNFKSGLGAQLELVFPF